MENLNVVTLEMVEYEGESIGRVVGTRLIKNLFVWSYQKFTGFFKSLLTSVPFEKGLSASFLEIAVGYFAPPW